MLNMCCNFSSVKENCLLMQQVKTIITLLNYMEMYVLTAGTCLVKYDFLKHTKLSYQMLLILQVQENQSQINPVPAKNIKEQVQYYRVIELIFNLVNIGTLVLLIKFISHSKVNC